METAYGDRRGSEGLRRAGRISPSLRPACLPAQTPGRLSPADTARFSRIPDLGPANPSPAPKAFSTTSDWLVQAQRARAVKLAGDLAACRRRCLARKVCAGHPDHCQRFRRQRTRPAGGAARPSASLGAAARPASPRRTWGSGAGRGTGLPGNTLVATNTVGFHTCDRPGEGVELWSYAAATPSCRG